MIDTLHERCDKTEAYELPSLSLSLSLSLLLATLAGSQATSFIKMRVDNSGKPIHFTRSSVLYPPLNFLIDTTRTSITPHC